MESILQALAQGWTPAVRLHNYQNMTLQPEQTHNLFSRQTHPLFLASACGAPPQLGKLWQSCFGMQYVWVSRGVGCCGGTWKWVKAFRRRPQSAAKELLSWLSPPPLNNCLHVLCKPLPGPKSYLGRGPRMQARP